MTPSPIDDIRSKAMESRIIEVLRTIHDPEIPVNIYDMGLIYDIICDADGGVDIKMTLTSPACPVAGTLPPQVEQRIAALPDVTRATVELVWEPPWSPSRMSEAARLELNLDADEPPARGPRFFDMGRR